MRPLLCLLLACLAPVAAENPPFHERVNRAIDDGVAWLKQRQNEDGTWDAIDADRAYTGSKFVYLYPAGPTALSLLALLKSGVAADDPCIQRGFAYLRKHHMLPSSTYELAVVMMAIEALHNPHKRGLTLEQVARREGRAELLALPKGDRAWMKRLATELVRRGQAGGGWRYGGDGRQLSDPPGLKRDLSNTQFAMMALYVAHRCGIRSSKKMIERTLVRTLDDQEKEGPRVARHQPTPGGSTTTDVARGWPYLRQSGNPLEAQATGTMTTGGLVVVLTARSMLADLSPAAVKKHDARIRRSIADGLAWLDHNWRVDLNPPPRVGRYHLYYLYGLERVGDLMRRNLIGRHDWYREGAEWLLDNRKPDGHWTRVDTNEPRDVLNTCFALLFLDRATLSVVTVPEKER